MDRILDALALGPGSLRRTAPVAICAAFVSAMIMIAAFQAGYEQLLGPDPYVTALWAAALWLMWSIWHSYWFIRQRAFYISQTRVPYRWAFVFDIFPGVCIGFSQMLRPLINGPVLRSWVEGGWSNPSALVTNWAFVSGAVICLIAIVAFAHAMKVIGVSNAGFVPEFVECENFQPVESGIYRKIRHPMFWSGILFSVGLALVGNTTTGYWIALVNIVYGPLYNYLEDHRLARVFGPRYGTYARRVPSCVPVFRR